MLRSYTSSATITASGNYVGGILGADGVDGPKSYINDCYSLATLSVGSDGYVGGILGSHASEWGNNTINITRCYFAGTMPESKQYGIVGHSIGNSHVSSCLTTMPNLVGNWNTNSEFPNELDDKSEANVESILARERLLMAKVLIRKNIGL